MRVKFKHTFLGMIFFIMLLASACGYAMTEDQAMSTEKPQENSGKVIVDTVETDEFSMDYCKFGTGEKVLVVLPGLSVQSVMASADAIAEAFKQYTDDYTVYVFERRNEMPESYTVSDTARDTVEAFRAVGLEKVSLFGASYGGMISMKIAVDNPELVEKMVLASTVAKVTDKEYETVGSWSRLAEEGDAKGLYLSFGEALYPTEVFEQSKQLLEDAAMTVTSEELKRFTILSEGMKGFDVTDKLNRIDCPVLLIGDEKDRVFNADAIKNIAQYLNTRPDFELYMYDGYGHAVYDLAPDFRDRMLKFLKSDPE